MYTGWVGSNEPSGKVECQNQRLPTPIQPPSPYHRSFGFTFIVDAVHILTQNTRTYRLIHPFGLLKTRKAGHDVFLYRIKPNAVPGQPIAICLIYPPGNAEPAGVRDRQRLRPHGSFPTDPEAITVTYSFGPGETHDGRQWPVLAT